MLDLVQQSRLILEMVPVVGRRKNRHLSDQVWLTTLHDLPNCACCWRGVWVRFRKPLSNRAPV